MKLKAHQKVLVASMGKLLRATAIFHTEREANKYLETHDGEGVIAELGPYIFIADLYDKGE